MYRVIRQDLIHLSDQQYRTLKYLCHLAKNLYNQALFNVRKEYFESRKRLSYVDNYHLLKDSPNYKKLNSSLSITILRKVDAEIRSFFGLLKAAKEKKVSGKIRLPNYLPKKGYFQLEIPHPRVKEGKLVIPVSRTFKKNRPEAEKIEIAIPPNLDVSALKIVRIVPSQWGRFFTAEYIYQVKEEGFSGNGDSFPLDKSYGAGIDFGVKNLMTCATNKGECWILDGKKLKSILNLYETKINALKRARDLEGYAKEGEDYRHSRKRTTEQMKQLARKRDNAIRDYLSKAARKQVEICRELGIGTLVVGYNLDFQNGSDMDRKSNRFFMKIPFGKLRKKLHYLCDEYGIIYVEQEESYTSASSFFDFDPIPVFGEKGADEIEFNGVRKKRGLYVRNNGQTVNCDVQAALNIMRKADCKAVDIQEELDILCRRGLVRAPQRIYVD